MTGVKNFQLWQTVRVADDITHGRAWDGDLTVVAIDPDAEYQIGVSNGTHIAWYNATSLVHGIQTARYSIVVMLALASAEAFIAGVVRGELPLAMTAAKELGIKAALESGLPPPRRNAEELLKLIRRAEKEVFGESPAQ